MITFYNKRQENGLYHCESVRTFTDFAPGITRTFTGTIDQLRDELRKDYRLHLDRLVLMLSDHIKPERNHFEQIQFEKLVEATRLCKYADHVSFAKELRQVELQPMMKRHLESYRFQTLFENTLDFIIEGEKSLWVRGPIELLDGTIVEPWKTRQDENRPAA